MSRQKKLNCSGPTWPPEELQPMILQSGLEELRKRLNARKTQVIINDNGSGELRYQQQGTVMYVRFQRFKDYDELISILW